MNIIIIAVLGLQGMATAYEGLVLIKRCEALQVRVKELEEYRTVQEESQRQLQRLAAEKLKYRKVSPCQKIQPRSL